MGIGNEMSIANDRSYDGSGDTGRHSFKMMLLRATAIEPERNSTMKKRLVSVAISAIAALSLAACGSSNSASTAASTVQNSQVSAAAESSSNEGADSTAVNGTSAQAAGSTASGSSKSLIVYFDYSENMGDTSGMKADAITRASLAGQDYDGITKNDLLVMRDEIQKQTGADTFSVVVTDPYDPDYEKMVGVAQDDQNDNKKFSFVNKLPDLSGYDTIYMGMPVWWGGLPQPMVSFLDQNDFSGKTIIPFGINLGSGFGQMIDQIKKAEPDATVSDDGLTENAHTANDKVVSDVDSWLRGLS